MLILVPRQNTSKDLSQQDKKEREREYGDTWQFVTRNHVLTNLCQWSR
jgi:hypothetical protein